MPSSSDESGKPGDVQQNETPQSNVPDHFESVDLVDSMETIEYDADNETFRAEYDTDQNQTSIAVAAVIAAAKGTDPMELSPLYTCIDTNALDGLFVPSKTGEQRCSFHFEGFEVTVSSAGMVEAAPIEVT
jgi:hypothetical protein